MADCWAGTKSRDDGGRSDEPRGIGDRSAGSDKEILRVLTETGSAESIMASAIAASIVGRRAMNLASQARRV